MITEISTAISILDILHKGYNYLKNLEGPIDRAYRNALQKWAPKHETIRATYANKKISTIEMLSQYIIDNQSIVGDIKQLLEYFEKELKKDTLTYQLIIEILERENLKISRENLDVCKDIQTNIHGVNEKMEKALVEHSHIFEYLEYISRQLEPRHNIIMPSVQYSDIEGYIQRTARKGSPWSLNIYLAKNGFSSKHLSQYIVDEEKRIILYSDAHFGKSTELKRLAFELYDSGLYNPFLFSLSQYTGKVCLDKLIKIDDRFNGEKINVLILDGLDEVADDHRVDLITEIENIGESNPDLYIVVSCRSNFEGTNVVNGFSKLYLNQLNWTDIEVFIKKKCKNSDILIEEIKSKEYNEFVFNPFYLNESIEYFNKNGKLPANKTILYEEFINKCFSIDGSRKRSKGILPLKTKLYPELERIAFCMLSSQCQEITIDSLYSELNIEENVILQCLNSSILQKDEQNNVKFLHNSFKEYIVAKYLSQLTFQQIQTVICYCGTTKIKPTMYNTSVLLVGVINKSDKLYKELISWLISDYKELLVICGFEILEEEQRNQIFKDIFNDHKQKQLWIDYDFLKLLIQFANTKESLQFLLDQIKENDNDSTNMLNTLYMLKYAKFSLMQSDEFALSKQFLLSILSKHKGDIEHGDYFCYPFENECFLTSAIISEYFEIIQETTNCNVIDKFCLIIYKANQCDQYADWVFSKAQYVRGYKDENNISHSVSKYYLIEYFKNLKLPQNILRAISYCEKVIGSNIFWSDEDSWETSLFQNLIKYTNKEDEEIIDEVLLMIKSVVQLEINSPYCLRYYSFINANTNSDEIFDKYYRIAMQLLNELCQTKTRDEEKWVDFNQTLNIVVVLLNKARLNYILNDTTADERLIYCLCSHIISYPVIDGDIIAQINTQFEHLNKSEIDWDKRRQEAFDILFQRELFTKQVNDIIEGKDRIDITIDNRAQYFGENINNSVRNFILGCREGLKEYIVTHEIKGKLTNDIEYKCFLLSQLPISSLLYDEERISISASQKEEIKETVIFALKNPEKFSNLDEFIIIIVEYNLVIPDDLLMTLFPYFKKRINYKQKNIIEDTEYKVSSIFLDYLNDHISDRTILDNKIEETINSSDLHQISFWQTITEHIVVYKKCHLYKYFEQLILKDENISNRLTIIICITKLGRDGVLIANDMLNYLSDKYQLYYYEHILFPEDKSKITCSERAKICQTIETNYLTDKYKIKDHVLRVLFQMGSIKALDWGLEYAESTNNWVCQDIFPSLQKYNGNHIEKLSIYFEKAISAEIPQCRVHSMLESTIYALKNIANESEEMRDKIIGMFRQQANSAGLAYLHRIADETYDRYFENNSGVITLSEASNLYIKCQR